MAKKNKGRGLIKSAYLIIFVLFILLIWLFNQSKKQNYSELSLKFNNALIDIFVKNGIKNKDINKQSRREHKDGTVFWIEYNYEIIAADTIDKAKLLNQIEMEASSHELKFEKRDFDDKTILLKILSHQKVLSNISLISDPAAQEKTFIKKEESFEKRVAIVIDDIGSNKDLSGFLNLGIPITFAIMPHEIFSKQIAKDLTDRKMPYILHLPMEPEAYPKVNPGKAALLVKMNESEIKEKFQSDINSVPGVVGVSNHMGSRFSADADKMMVLLKLVKEKGLFYFDSYTTPKTKAAATAKKVEIPFLVNEMFLDVKDEHDFMKKQCGILLKRTEKYGYGIAIAHIQRKNIVPVLKEIIPQFKNAGIKFVYLSDLVKNQSKQD